MELYRVLHNVLDDQYHSMCENHASYSENAIMEIRCRTTDNYYKCLMRMNN